MVDFREWRLPAEGSTGLSDSCAGISSFYHQTCNYIEVNHKTGIITFITIFMLCNSLERKFLPSVFMYCSALLLVRVTLRDSARFPSGCSSFTALAESLSLPKGIHRNEFSNELITLKIKKKIKNSDYFKSIMMIHWNTLISL